MAYKIITKPHTGPVTTTWPFGKINNKTTGAPGTPVNELVYQDMHQFFAKMCFEAGITPNDTPDNADNGFQFFEALKKVAQPDWTNAGITFPTFGGVTFANVGGSLFDVSGKVSNNEVSLAGSATTASLPAPGTYTVANLPASMRPAKSVYPRATVKKGSSEAIERIEITPTGDVKISTAGAVASTVQVWLDGITFRKI